MNEILTPSNIVFLIGVLGTSFGVYSKIQTPQIQLDKDDSLMKQSIIQLTKDFANLRDNHVHTLELKIDDVKETQTKMMVEMAKISTTIEERIPKRSV